MRPGSRPSGIRVIVAVVVTTLVATVGASAAGIGPLGLSPEDGDQAELLSTSARGAISIVNSHAGRSVLEAAEMVPGSVTRGTVWLANTGAEPFGTSLALGRRPGDPLARALELDVRERGAGGQAGPLYRGPLAGMPRIPLGPTSPRGVRGFDLTARLPASAGDELQGGSISVDFVWSARGAGPPPECRVRAMRARLFIFRNRNVIRLVSRYRAMVGSRVAIDFYERRRGGRRGRKVGTLVTKFRRSPLRFRRGRVAQVRPPAEMRRYRNWPRGYIATLRVGRAPGYCSQHLNFELVELRRFFRQFVWFQRGSFTTRRARINSGE